MQSNFSLFNLHLPRRAAFTVKPSSTKLSILSKSMRVWMARHSSCISFWLPVQYCFLFSDNKLSHRWVNAAVVVQGRRNFIICSIFPAAFTLQYIYFRLETGTARNTGSVSDDGIDYDWLPQSTIKELSKKVFEGLIVMVN